MFEHIKIIGNEIFNEIKLLNLGRVNVVCGKNNSGKTTLLKSLVSEKNAIAGITRSDDKVQTIAEKLFFMGNLSRAGIFRPDVEEVLKTVLGRDAVWFFSDVGEYVSDATKRQEGHWRLRAASVAWQMLLNVFREIIVVPSEKERFFVSPKRRLILALPVGNSFNHTEHGESLLRIIFSIKNCTPNTAEKKVFDRIKQAFEEISSGHKFDISITDNNLLVLKFSTSAGKKWIDADKCGLGLQDLLVMLYYAISPEYKIVLIEEPENHLHPDMQRKLLAFLARQEGKQFFLSTHSNVFLDNALVDSVFLAKYEGGKISISDETSKASMLDDLGYSVADNLLSDLVILVEGPTDIPVIEEFLVKFGLYGNYNIKLWPLGGDIMDQVDLSIFKEYYKIIAIVDKDTGSTRVRRRFVKKCDEASISVTKLQRYSLENYFSLRVLREVFGSQIDSSISSLDPGKKVEAQIGFDVKKNNRQLAKKMTVEEIKGTDLERFFKEVEKLCNEG